MRAEDLIAALPCRFYTGVPDSQLKALCDTLYRLYGIGEQHCIAQNEGGALALAAGYYLATGKIPCVYLQNSGIGNITNPVCSLTSTDVYAIPTVFVVGWRGEPNVKDEPQHVYQGKVTMGQLKTLSIETFVVDQQTRPEDIRAVMNDRFMELLNAGRSVAFVVKKGSLRQETAVTYRNAFTLTREEVIEEIVKTADTEDAFVSTTGKASRELFEIRARRKEGHERDFLTVGSMGHCAMIALGIAEQQRNRRVWCLDGDGAALMHLGAWAVIGSRAPGNMVHVLLNNTAHDSVGGMPTVSAQVDYEKLALACGYRKVWKAETMEQLQTALLQIKDTRELTLLEAAVQIGSREDLGRPTTTPQENKMAFMNWIKGEKQS